MSTLWPSPAQPEGRMTARSSIESTAKIVLGNNVVLFCLTGTGS
jgi:hypothetical protein